MPEVADFQVFLELALDDGTRIVHTLQRQADTEEWFVDSHKEVLVTYFDLPQPKHVLFDFRTELYDDDDRADEEMKLMERHFKGTGHVTLHLIRHDGKILTIFQGRAGWTLGNRS